MNQVRRIARQARWRIRLQGMVAASGPVLLAVAGVVLVLAIVDRIGTAPIVPWPWAAGAIAAASITLMACFWARNATTELAAASEVDERLGLNERLSSALACENRHDAFADALRDDAQQVVEKEGVEAALSRTFACQAPPLLAPSIGMSIVAALFMVTGQWGWVHAEEAPIEVLSNTTRAQVEAGVEQVAAAIAESDALGEELQQELDDMLSASTAPDDPETMRRDALRRMTDMQQRLDDMLRDPDAIGMAELQRRLRSLELPGDDDGNSIAAALKRGDFKSASEALEQLMAQMESTDLDESTRKRLAEQLENLAAQLEELAKADAALRQALSAAGLDEALASDADAARRAIEGAKNLTEQQRQRLLDMLEAQQVAAEACKKMGDACRQCAGGDSGSLSGQLSDLEAAAMFLDEAALAKAACQSACASMRPGGAGEGLGHGGSGTGFGNKASFEQTETSTISHRSPVDTVDGAIIARQLFQSGVAPIGETQAGVRDAVLNERQAVEDAIADDEVPRRYHDLLRHYFGRLERLSESAADDADDS